MFIKSLVMRVHSLKVLTFLAGLLLLWFPLVSSSFGVVIYYDHFDGAEGVDLDGIEPQVTTDGAAWVAGSNFDADGTITFDNYGYGDSAYLPFVPKDGFVYTLSATIISLVSPYRIYSGTNDWIALGFAQSNANPDNRFYDDNGSRNPVYWATTRTNQSLSNDQTFIGPGEAYDMDTLTISVDDIKIVLDTTGTTWKVSWYYSGILQRMEDVTEDKKPYFQYVVMSNNRCDGIIRSFRLEDNTRILSAAKPNPADGDSDVPREAVLSWTPGDFADTHNLFFGTDFNDVNNADAANPPKDTLAETLDVNCYNTGRLEFNTTYYWRVDEINSSSSPATYKGKVWSFTAEPFAYKVPAEDIAAFASSSSPDCGPNNTINESGLNPDNMDLHSNYQLDMWISDEEVNDVWIRYNFDRVYKLHQMMVWNLNLPILFDSGFKDVTVEYSLDGQDWAEVPDVPQFAQGSGTNTYKYNTVVDLNNISAKSVRLTAKSNWSGGTSQYYGLSEIRYSYIPLLPREPKPANGAVNVPVDTALTWRAGREASRHNVYISTDEQAIIDGNAPFYTVTENSYLPELELGHTYYWRVDEINDAQTPALRQGDVWSFTTKEYVSIEDFEDYNDMQPYTIWDAWIDGITEPAYGGSQVGHYNAPYSEAEKVQHGDKSAPIYYDNTHPDVNDSEVVRTFDNAMNWQVNGADTLKLYYRGNTVTYAEPSEGNFAMSAEGADIGGTSDEFRFVYKALYADGSITARVDSIQNTNGWAKAGVMIRNTLDSDSAHAMTILAANGTASFQRRITKGDTAESTNTPEIGNPCWVRITRKGYKMIARYSKDGENWISLGCDPNVSSEETIVMNNKVYVGLAVTSHAANILAAATFSSVTTTGYAPDDWTVEILSIRFTLLSKTAQAKERKFLRRIMQSAQETGWNGLFLTAGSLLIPGWI